MAAAIGEPRRRPLVTLPADRRSRGELAAAVALFALLAVPLAHNGYLENLARGLLMFSSMALAWNVIGGFAGYVSFGNVAFFGIGAYTSAKLADLGVRELWLDVTAGAVAAALAAVLLGLPVLRLRGHYFGIATLAMALAIQELVANIDALGAGSGLTVRQAEPFSQYYLAMWLVCALSFATTVLLARSKFGYALVAIRENEEAAAVLGIATTRYKVAAWALSAAMCAAAGAVFACANGFIDPATAFAVDDNVTPIVMTILGGTGTTIGPLIGAAVLTLLNETLWANFAQTHALFFGIAVMVIVVLLPRGLGSLTMLRGGLAGTRNLVRRDRA